MARAYLGLGSNLGDKEVMIARALALLGEEPGIRIAGRSGDYRTPPWGDTDQDWFVNACAAIDTALAPAELLAACLKVENRLGRQRTRKWGPRSIDIDVLDYEGRAFGERAGLIAAAPFVLERAFVLVPLAELAPDLVIAGSTVRERQPASTRRASSG
jgi:2-amino-4-hydroxy-6-hydroxymethyldihydropteridine diphosphokinase